MTHKQIAEIIRRGQEDELNSLANELDPPKLEPGTVVWWRFRKDNKWQLGQVQEYNLLYSFGSDVDKEWADIKWKPARILADDEVAVKIPPVSEWPDFAHTLITLFEGAYKAERHIDVITRAEAERMEEGR